MIKYLSLIILLTLSISCSEKQKIDHYRMEPILVGTKLFENGDQPTRIRNFRDTLYISFLNKPAIDLYDLELNFISSIPLTHLDTVIPTSFYVTDSSILVTQHTKNRIILYTKDGKVVNSFGSMPDNFLKLFPYDITVYRGVAYVTDIMHKSVLAISLTSAENVIEMGELILKIPEDTTHRIQFPSAVTISGDGRLYVGNAGTGTIDVFTCAGNYVYRFDSISAPTPTVPAVESFAFDNIVDLKLLAKEKNSFDPSGIRNQGRLHALDVSNHQVHVYNPVGEYLMSYPTDSIFVNPSGIAIDILQRQIYITDPPASAIYIFSF